MAPCMRNAAGYSPQAFPHRITTGGLVDCGAFHFVQFARFVRCKNRGAKLPGAARNRIPMRNYRAVRFRCARRPARRRLKGVTGPRSAPLTPTRYPAPLCQRAGHGGVVSSSSSTPGNSDLLFLLRFSLTVGWWSLIFPPASAPSRHKARAISRGSHPHPSGG
jgi:hypothetical protein